MSIKRLFEVATILLLVGAHQESLAQPWSWSAEYTGQIFVHVCVFSDHPEGIHANSHYNRLSEEAMEELFGTTAHVHIPSPSKPRWIPNKERNRILYYYEASSLGRGSLWSFFSAEERDMYFSPTSGRDSRSSIHVHMIVLEDTAEWQNVDGFATRPLMNAWKRTEKLFGGSIF